MARMRRSGYYPISNEAFLKEKANGCRLFYAAMLSNSTCKSYLARANRKKITVEGCRQNPVGGRMEIIRARRGGRIADA